MDESMRLRLLAGLCAVSLLCACGNAQSRKASYIAHGREYLAAGNYEKARVEFSNAAQIDPKDAQVRYYLGQVAEQRRDIPGAAAQYRAAIAADPALAAARASLGRLFLTAGSPDDALKVVTPGLALEPHNPQLLTIRGAARARLNDMPGALEDAQTALRRAPNDQYAIALAASLYKQRSELDKAVSVVEAGLRGLPNNVDLISILADLYLAQQQPARAEAQLRRIIALQPKNVTYRYALAQFYLQQNKVDAAEKTLRDTADRLPENLDAKLQLVALLGTRRGLDQATTQVERFLAADPGNDKLRLLLGQLLAQTRHLDDAERAYRAVIAHAGTDPQGLQARDRLASLLIERKDLPAASVLITEVLKDSPSDNDALTLRANLSLTQDQAQSAITDLRAVLRDQSNSVGIMRTLALAYQQNNEPDLAEATLRAAVQISPADFQSRLELAHVLSSANKLDEAGPLLEQLAKDYPSSIPVQESLFRMQAALKRTAEARATAENIERLSPNEALGYCLAGLIDELDHQPDAAAKHFEQALQRDPDAEEPLAALVRLDVRLERTAAALALVDNVIAHSPDNLVARKLKGELLLSQGQVNAAIAVGQDGVRIAPSWPQGYESLALAQVMAGRSNEAIHTLQLGIDRAQSTSSLLSDLSHLYERLGRPDDAIALYDGFLGRNPKSTFAANNLAMLLVTYRHDAASLGRAQNLSDQLASSSEVTLVDTRGWVKFKSGDFHGAESLLQQAVDRAPTTPELRYHLGMAQLRSGEQQAARQNLEVAVSADHPFSGKDEAKAALAQLTKSAPDG
jgi:tetratricopeptide (TPR) repeat protein